MRLGKPKQPHPTPYQMHEFLPRKRTAHYYIVKMYEALRIQGCGGNCIGDRKKTHAWQPFVLGPLLAIDRSPGWSCVTEKFSSAKLLPYIDTQPVPSPCIGQPHGVDHSSGSRPYAPARRKHTHLKKVPALNHKVLDYPAMRIA
jgi:hypothetical protein